MNIAEYSVTKKVTTWLLIILFLAGGVTALQDISRLEDPEFTIKEAKVYTTYPGATRFTLVYSPESPSTSYGQIIVTTETLADVQRLQEQILDYTALNFPDSEPKTKPLRIGPGRDAKIKKRNRIYTIMRPRTRFSHTFI